MSDCGACTGETNIKLCHDHTTRIEQDLAEVDSVVDNLGVSIARLDVGAPSSGSSGPTGSKPPINLDAMERHDQLRAVLAGWAMALEGNNIFHRVSTKNIASYLFTRIDSIRTVEWAYELLDELGEAMERARTATDRALDRISVGACGECNDTITAIVGAAIGRCRTCGTTVDVNAWREDLLARAWHVRAPLPQILRALKHGGHASLPATRVEWWIKKGTLVAEEGNLYTPAAVMRAYWETPSGRKARPESSVKTASVA